jgi:DNA-binding response OmpR family regulator
MMQRILIVDDDPTHTKLMRFLLDDEGYETEAVDTGARALAALTREQWDLLVLDCLLPDMAGLDLCRQIREQMTIPILFISALGDVQDKIKALRAGGDDYMAKPFDPSEMLARVWALLRRGSQLTNSEKHLSNADLVVHPTDHKVTLARTGKTIDLTPLEGRLLRYLVSNPGRSLTRDALMYKIWGYDFDRTSNQLDVYIARLRQKIEEDPSNPRLIVTVRGVGYRFQPSATRDRER